MKIEINLSDSKYCNDCPLHTAFIWYRPECGLKYKLPEVREDPDVPYYVIDRPQDCIIRNGK